MQVVGWSQMLFAHAAEVQIPLEEQYFQTVPKDLSQDDESSSEAGNGA